MRIILTTAVTSVLVATVTAVVVAVTDPLTWNTDGVVALELLRTACPVHYTNTHTHSFLSSCENVDKKLRYRKEHSASVVLSWCTYDISREKTC